MDDGSYDYGLLKSIDELKAEVKALKEDTQHAAQADSVMPQEQTADDIIRKFIEGGK